MPYPAPLVRSRKIFYLVETVLKDPILKYCLKNEAFNWRHKYKNYNLYMTVKELRELLTHAPDNMEVVVSGGEDALGKGFLFLGACQCDSGIICVPKENESITNGAELEKVFAVLPHGFGATQEQLDKMGESPIPEIEN